MNVKINKLVDFIERVGWTAIQAASAAGIVALTTDDITWNSGLQMVGFAAAVAALKVIVAQNTGSNDLGSATPGQVIKEG